MGKINKSLALSLGIVFIVFSAIFITNFPFHSWYTGWDNLHPEFNFFLNFKRGLSAVWQDNQGLGTYGGHGYAATLPHTIFTFLMSFLIPTQYLRASFTFLMLGVGTIGAFFLIRLILKDKHESLRNNAALVGSLFYMLNLGTVQQFYIQLEAFIIHFALLPWLFYSLLNFLENKTKKNLILFFVVSIASTAQGFIPPLFIAYTMFLVVFLVSYILFRPTLDRVKTAFLIITLTFIANSYWLLPVGYYSLTQSKVYLNSYNNISSTQDFNLKSKKYGNISDVALLKSFIFDAIDGNQDGKTFLIFKIWTDHLKKNGVEYIGYLFFGVIILGALSLARDKNKYINLALLLSFILCLSLLAINTFPFSALSDLVHKIPIINQAFRVSFTKFSIATAFFYSIFLAIGLSRILPSVKYPNLATLISILLLIYFSLPAIKGNFLYTRTKIEIPDSYFQLFKFFNEQDKKTRIANLPTGWNWGWSIYRWGYSGSGFLWYGISQPIMDRAFDVWGSANENYHWELSYAIFSENFYIVDKLMDKYKVGWVILDKNVIPYLNTQEYLYSQRTEEYLDHSDKFKLVKIFKSINPKVREIKVYAVKLNNQPDNFRQILTAREGIKNIGPLYDFTNYDSAYQKYEDYYTNLEVDYDTYYPFRSIFTNRKTEEIITDINEDGSNIIFKAKIPQNLRRFSLNLPPLDPNFDLENPNVINDKGNLIITVPKNETIIYEGKNDPDFLNPKTSNCQTTNFSKGMGLEILQGNILKFNSKNTQNCHTIILSQLGQRFSYLIRLESKHIKGRKLELAVVNHQTKNTTLDILLPDKNSFVKSYVILPPMKYYGLGYSLNFLNISIGNTETINGIKNISIYRIPFYFLTHIELLNPDRKQSNNDSIFALYQSYNSDWKAYQVEDKNLLSSALPFIFGKELKNHVLVNNWANGWALNSSFIPNHSSLYIVYLPQYLEYLGFLILLLVPIYLFRLK